MTANPVFEPCTFINKRTRGQIGAVRQVEMLLYSRAVRGRGDEETVLQYSSTKKNRTAGGVHSKIQASSSSVPLQLPVRSQQDGLLFEGHLSWEMHDTRPPCSARVRLLSRLSAVCCRLYILKMTFLISWPVIDVFVHICIYIHTAFILFIHISSQQQPDAGGIWALSYRAGGTTNRYASIFYFFIFDRFWCAASEQ